MNANLDGKFNDVKKEMRDGLHSMDFTVKELTEKVEAGTKLNDENQKAIEKGAEVTEGLQTK